MLNIYVIKYNLIGKFFGYIFIILNTYKYDFNKYIVYNIIILCMGIDDFTIRHFRTFMYKDVNEFFDVREEQDMKEYIAESNSIGTIQGREYKIRIYSSVDTRTDRVRESDAIRVNIVDEYGDALVLENEKYRHLKRTKNWRDNLLNRINKYQREFPKNIELCPKCSSALKFNRGKHGRFISCTNWLPNNDDNCGYTRSA